MSDFKRIMDYAKERIIEIKRPVKHHFRDRYHHMLRVMKWGERIQAIEGGDIDVVRTACMLHDIGWHDRINHAVISRRLSEEFLRGIGYEADKLPKVLEAIEFHNARESNRGFNLETWIVMDADILDEVGAISCVWDAMATCYDTDANYQKAYQRIVDNALRLRKERKLLKTDAGRRFYDERLAFIDSFLREMDFELGGK